MSPLPILHLTVFEAGPLTEPGVRQISWPSSSRALLSLAPQPWYYRLVLPHLAFDIDAGQPNSSPHASSARAPPWEPCPLPRLPPWLLGLHSSTCPFKSAGASVSHGKAFLNVTLVLLIFRPACLSFVTQLWAFSPRLSTLGPPECALAVCAMFFIYLGMQFVWQNNQSSL